MLLGVHYATDVWAGCFLTLLTISLSNWYVEKTYNEIYEFLIKYLEITKYLNIKNKIYMENVPEINKKEILEKILGDIKKKEQNPKFIEFLRNVKKLKNNSALNNNMRRSTVRISDCSENITEASGDRKVPYFQANFEREMNNIEAKLSKK